MVKLMASKRQRRKHLQPFQNHSLLTNEYGCPLHTLFKERLPEPDIACICYTTPCHLTATLSFTSTIGENNHHYNEIL